MNRIAALNQEKPFPGCDRFFPVLNSVAGLWLPFSLKPFMSYETHSQIASFIWSICNLLRGPYKRNEYRKVILPLTVLRRFDCILASTKPAVLKEHAAIKAKGENIIRHRLSQITGVPFFNLSKFTMAKPEPGSGLNGLLDDPNQLAPNLNSYINSFSPNVRAIMERFDFGTQIAKMADKDLLYLVVKRFAAIDLSPARVDNIQMGYVFEELIRIGAEQSNEEAGEHFTPREVIKLMVNLLLSPEKDLARSHVVKTIYDPACGTGGMLSVAEKYIRDLNADAQPKLFGQDWNDEAWAVCKSDMLIKGEDADNIIRDDTFTKDGFDRDARPSTTCSPTRPSAWSGNSSSVTSRTSATPSVSADASARARRA
jgi:type I restriction enzyme M protein